MTALLADPVPAPSARPVPVRPGRSDRGASARRPVAVPPREWAHVPRAAAIPVGVDPAASSVAQVSSVELDAVRPVRPVDAEGAVPAVPPASSAPRYEWTNRGIAVLLLLVAGVVTLMTVTLMSAFLAVSDEPIPARPSVMAAVAAP